MEEINQRIRLTIKLLEEALISLLEEKSIFNVSIKELCDVAGINRSTFYKHFNNQFDLLHFMEERFLNDIIDYLNENKNINIPIKKRIKKVLDYIVDNYKFSKLLINNNIDPSFSSKLFNSPYILDLAKVQKKNLTNNKLNDYGMIFILEGCYNIIKKWINDGCDVSTTELANFIIQLTVNYE